jgi:hypothetical protein
MILYKYSFNVFVCESFVGIVHINSFDHSHARNHILDFLYNKYCNYWELEQMIKIFNFNIQSYGNVEMTHDNIITIDYSVKFESNLGETYK